MAARSGRVSVTGLRGVIVSAEPDPAAGCAVVLELGGAVLRIAADAPPALVAAVVWSLRDDPGPQ